MLSSLTRRAARSYATLKPAPFGQPRPESHPHLLKEGEMTGGIQSAEYAARRARLVDALPDDSIVVAAAAPINYRYRQNSNFWYLTGWAEHNAAIIIQKSASSSRGYKLSAFVAPKDENEELWDGARTGLDAAAGLLGADEVYDYKRFVPELQRVLNTSAAVTYVESEGNRTTSAGVPHYVQRTRDPDPWLLEFFTSPRTPRRRDLKRELAKLRTVKSPAEQEVMRAAAEITARAHTKTMCYAKPGLGEAQLEAHFAYLCARDGAQRPAYVPVVASGANALAIHYVANNALLESGEMVLMDAGCEYNGYASDLSASSVVCRVLCYYHSEPSYFPARTFPVNGTFTSPQADLYAAVLSVQKASIPLCTADAGYNAHDLYFHACRLLHAELTRLGFDLKEREVERVLCPHGVSHSVGIDLHEPHFDSSEKLKEGMVITVEPGVYIPPLPRYPKHFYGLGIRIEDEVLVQKDHSVVLTSSAPKEIVDVEGACQDVLRLGAM
ncbi:Creatinase/aminopeptidase [Exidia glandulosa HHB12029]|uniref:Creatinase/aminopeptidase n=1 Tax=Exidia glandulosa HHB12029 TaxID=1314781 RepID=A0A165IX29_EXIGL|nr:Creatinase/aminopeptidase [Exidia glandulosa HHB12029]